MELVFESKIRRVGSSFGLLIPKEVVKTRHLEAGKPVMVALLERDPRAVSAAFGWARGATSFTRDHAERHLR